MHKLRGKFSGRCVLIQEEGRIAVAKEMLSMVGIVNKIHPLTELPVFKLVAEEKPA